MKKTKILLVAVLVIVFTLSVVLSACDLARKINGAEISFPTKVSNAETIFFNMDIDYKKGAKSTQINMKCYNHTTSDKDVYAYVYSCPQGAYSSYKNIYADSKLHEIVNFTTNTGSYYTKNDVSVDANENMLYHVKKNILLLSAAALVKKANKETLNGETVYRYDVDVDGKTISIWYNSEFLVKCYVKFEGKDGEADEEYTLSLSGYKFDEPIPDEIFASPDTYGLGYIESPFSFESWMEIMTSFAGKLGK